MINIRAHAAQYLSACHKNQGLVDEAPYLKVLPEQDISLFRQLCFGVYRAHSTLEFLLNHVLKQPLNPDEMTLKYLLMIGIYQLKYLRIPEHAAIFETVEACQDIRQVKAKGLVNGCLRSYQREQDTLDKAIEEDESAFYAHPAWIIEQIKDSHPEYWAQILEANNIQGPLSLRVNQRHHSKTEYLKLLEDNGIQAHDSITKTGLVLDVAMNVERLPGFKEGWVSVQDLAAQLAAPLLQIEDGMHVLDACAAPGGKAAHCLEQNTIRLLAADNNQSRLRKVAQNFDRLHVKGGMLCADLTKSHELIEPASFDRILLDAPCSATGVIRRHPDIKVYRTQDHVNALMHTQGKLLKNLWKALKPGGIFLYATCSVLKGENDLQIEAFLTQHPDAKILPITESWGHATPFGRQILPGQNDMDGFYYARMVKTT